MRNHFLSTVQPCELHSTNAEKCGVGGFELHLNRVAPKDATRLSFEEYLELEERSETRHEFVDGFMFAMTGGTDNHNQITINILTQARLKTRASSCRAYASDMKVRTPDGTGYYPDVFVTCDEPNDGSQAKYNPYFIVEVLSPSTEAFDRGEKQLRYRQISSLQAYVLVTQHRKLIEVYRRLPDGTWRYETLEESGTLELPYINLPMTLEGIYEDVEFQNSSQQNSIQEYSIQE
jgi:Uma2 family endonuclease